MKKIILSCLFAISATFCSQALIIRNKTSKTLEVHEGPVFLGKIAPKKEFDIKIRSNIGHRIFISSEEKGYSFIVKSGVDDNDPMIIEFNEHNGTIKIRRLLSGVWKDL